MKLTRVATVAFAVGAAVVAAGTAQPAVAKPAELKYCDYICTAAAEITAPAYKYEAQVDNKHTATGSWIWVWGKGKGAHADYYQEGDDQMRQIFSPKNGSNSKELTRKVVQFRVCGPNGIGGDFCSDWWAPKPWRS
ncbi:hypothetical protein [Kribbella albertanoniae]|uniref:Secreted protein n=1 Tax=Kribbella albertanoniae TaxID=1266829 RepID=A0A4R4Q355_9ACTN|nr:hypothetical protein [Kribbella albertanoniae]TDC29272.1 hypothetical protein E1261_16170 [Kribbella albertanoniae]